MAKKLHRDDLDMDLVEELTSKLQELHPGFKVVFAGDSDNLPPEMEAQAKELDEWFHRALHEGRCVDCGAQMPNWPDKPDDVGPDWRLPKGWAYLTEIGKEESSSWICPTCDAEEPDGVPRPVRIPDGF